MSTNRLNWLTRAASIVIIITMLIPMFFGGVRSVKAETTRIVDLTYTDSTPGWGVTAFATIQSAVIAAVDGDTIQVHPGTYIEQVSIDKNITLIGENKLTTIIQAPAVMNQDCTSPQLTNSPIVCVNNQKAPTIQGFTIDGLKSAGSHVRLMGLAIRNAGGIVQDLIVKNICFETDADPQCDPSSADEGVGIYVYNSVIETQETINILNNEISTFNKNGITITSQASWDPVTFLVQGNTINGLGVNQTTVQNGIQVELPKGSGSITGNIINNIAFNNSANPNPLVANSILVLSTALFEGLQVTTNSNIMSNTQGGIYYLDGQGLISNNTITVIKPGVAGKVAYGILASDPPWAIPSPYGGNDPTNQQASNSLALLAPLDTLAVEVANNTASFEAVDNLYTVGIASHAGLANISLDINFHNNTISGFADGIGLYYCNENACPLGIYTGLDVVGNNLSNNVNGIRLTGYHVDLLTNPFTPNIHHNRIFENTVGIRNDTYDQNNDRPVAIVAENNWWGCNGGPGSLGCQAVDPFDFFGTVDMDPWLVLSTTANPASVLAGGTSTLTADLNHNSLIPAEVPAGFVMNGIPVTFSAKTLGSVNPLSAVTSSGAAQTTFTAPAAQGAYEVCAVVDNQETCSTVTVLPALITDFDLLQSVDQTTWTPVPGSYASGFTMFLDPLEDFYYLDADNFTANRTLADGLYPFFVITYPADYFNYWDGRGVNAAADPVSWQGIMWKIINGDLPIFYLKVVGSETILVDGLQYNLPPPFGSESFLRIDGTYLTGTYTFSGEVDDTTGYANPVAVEINFVHYPTLNTTDLAGPYTTGVQQEFHVTLDNANGADYIGVLAHFRIANAVLTDIASLEYWEVNSSTWLPLPLSADGLDLVGDYGPPVTGFPMPAGYNATSLFRVTFSTAKSYDVTVTLSDLAPEPDVTLASMTRTAVVTAPVEFNIFLPIIFK